MAVTDLIGMEDGTIACATKQLMEFEQYGKNVICKVLQRSEIVFKCDHQAQAGSTMGKGNTVRPNMLPSGGVYYECND